MRKMCERSKSLRPGRVLDQGASTLVSDYFYGVILRRAVLLSKKGDGLVVP
jgi:hypothetical protein